MQIKLGCDPEAFLMDAQGYLKSSVGLIGGSKMYPLPLPLGDGYAVQEDNVALEFNIPPASNRSEFVDSISKTLAFLTKVVDENYGLRINQQSAASFSAFELDSPGAQLFGCDPDYNAWTDKVNPRPNAADKSLRSCGGHVHIGYDITKAGARSVIKMMDLFLGVPSVLMDTGELRKQLYGSAGAYREKSYGVEYRTLSNFWIFKERLIEYVWDNTNKAVAAAESQLTLSDEDTQNIVTAINQNDKGLASMLIKKFNLEVIHAV